MCGGLEVGMLGLRQVCVGVGVLGLGVVHWDWGRCVVGLKRVLDGLGQGIGGRCTSIENELCFAWDVKSCGTKSWNGAKSGTFSVGGNQTMSK